MGGIIPPFFSLFSLFTQNYVHMKRYMPVILLFLPLCFHLNAQNHYYSPEGKTYLNVSKEKIVIGFKNQPGLSSNLRFFPNFKILLSWMKPCFSLHLS